MELISKCVRWVVVADKTFDARWARKVTVVPPLMVAVSRLAAAAVGHVLVIPLSLTTKDDVDDVVVVVVALQEPLNSGHLLKMGNKMSRS